MELAKELPRGDARDDSPGHEAPELPLPPPAGDPWGLDGIDPEAPAASAAVAPAPLGFTLTNPAALAPSPDDKPRRRKGSRGAGKGIEKPFPEEFQPSPEICRWARSELGFDEPRVRQERERFRDKAVSKGWMNVQWGPAFKNWLRKEREFDDERASRQGAGARAVMPGPVPFVPKVVARPCRAGLFAARDDMRVPGLLSGRATEARS